MKHHRMIIFLFTILSVPLSAAWQSERSFSSPDGALVFRLGRDGATGTIADEGQISRVETRSVNTTWKPPYGERSTIPDKFREEILMIEHEEQGNLSVNLQVRACDEGIAFRSPIRDSGKRTVSWKKNSFPRPAESKVWTSAASQGKITGQAVSLANDFAAPWRCVRAAKSPGALREGNHFTLNLNEPDKIGGTSWLRSGKVLREIPLTFLDAGKNYRLELFSDSPSVNIPTKARIESSEASSQSVLRRPVAKRNGLAAILTPEFVSTQSAS